MNSKPFGAGVEWRGEHGGVVVYHRFGADGDWSAVMPGDIVASTEEMAHIHGGQTVLPPCPGCDSVITELPPAAFGVSHAAGCPWLAAAPPPDWRLP